MIEDRAMNQIYNVAQAIEWAKGLSKEWGFLSSEDQPTKDRQLPIHVWYRGHTASKHELIPEIFREAASTNNKTYEEGGMLIHLMRRLPQYQDSYHSTFDALCLSRHYELSCRLLDWTENVLIALWFAVQDNKEGSKNDNDGKIFALNSGKLCEITEFKHYKRNEPGVYGPKSFNVVLRTELAMTAYLDELFLCPSVRESALSIGFSNQFLEQLIKIVASLKEKDIVYIENNSHFDDFISSTPFSIPQDFLDDAPEALCETQYDLLPIWLQESGDELSSTAKSQKVKEWIFHFLYSLRMPVSVFPERRNPRIVAQSGMFVLAGGDFLPNKLYRDQIECRNPNPIHLQSWHDKDDVLRYAIIPSQDKKNIRDDLEIIGFHAANLFPDFDKQAKYIQDFWKVEKWTST